MKANGRKVKGSHLCSPGRTLTDADISRLSAAITTAIIAAHNPKEEVVEEVKTVPTPQKKSVRDILRVFFCPLKKLKIQNSAVSLVKIVTSVACQAISKIGYVLAVLMVVAGVLALCSTPGLYETSVAVTQIAFAVVIWLMSRLLAATGIEIEQTDNENLVFSVSAFILAIIAIVISM